MNRDEYSREILAAYDGEVRGEAFFRALAEQPELRPVAGDLLILATLEGATRQRMLPVMERLQLATSPSLTQEAAGWDRAERWRGASPERFWTMLSELVEPFVAQYDALAMGAEEEDRDILNYVAAHERALADYSRLALQDRGAAALAPVLALLPPGG